MKLVINACYGGFSLSRDAFLKLREMGNKWALSEPDYGEKWSDGSVNTRSAMDRERGFFLRDMPRDDLQLVAIVEQMGEAANGACARLRIVEIPDDVAWEIDDYDGSESVHEKHRSWT